MLKALSVRISDQIVNSIYQYFIIFAWWLSFNVFHIEEKKTAQKYFKLTCAGNIKHILQYELISYTLELENWEM